MLKIPAVFHLFIESIPYAKPFFIPAIRLPLNINIGDPRAGRAGIAFPDCLFDGPFFTLKDRLNPAVPEVFRPAAQAKAMGNVARKSTVENTLHPAVDKQVRPRIFHMEKL